MPPDQWGSGYNSPIPVSAYPLQFFTSLSLKTLCYITGSHWLWRTLLPAAMEPMHSKHHLPWEAFQALADQLANKLGIMLILAAYTLIINPLHVTS